MYMRHHRSSVQPVKRSFIQLRVAAILIVCLAIILTIIINVVQVDAKRAAVAQSNTKLKSLVSTFTSNYPSGIGLGLVVIDTSNGAAASYDGDTQFVSASIYKLFVAYDVYRQVDAGTVSLDQSITTADPDDLTNTVEGCLNLMITISDNDCGVSLGELDSWSNLDSILKSQGYNGTMLNNYDSSGAVSGDKQTTAADVALLLERLYKSELLKPTTTSDFINLLKQQTINDSLPSGLPLGTIIAHKTGALYGYVHDAGIIYSAKKNVIVVMLTGQWDNPETEADPAFAQLSSAVWSYIQN